MNKLEVTQVADASSLAQTQAYSFTADWNKVVSVQAVWTSSSSSFTLTLQYSNDGSTWTDYTTGTAISNSSSSVMWDVANTNKDALYWRVNAARSSGTLTTLKIYFASVQR